MTAEEKAKELVDRYGRLIKENTVLHMVKPTAKQCALICIEEIIASSDHAGGWDTYWQQVKEAILKL